jgi:class 3 adenylate cyclase
MDTSGLTPPAATQTRTFLIADVRGYTRFTREHGDIEAARLATRFADLVRDAIESRNGHVIELRGDEALAVFTSESQAVRAALELQATLAEESAADTTLPLPVGIGIDSGEAVPVGGGYRGAALNLAARLCARAEAGQVLVSASVRHIGGDVDIGVFGSRGHAELKGFEEPIEVFEAVSSIRRLEMASRSSEPAAVPPGLAVSAELIGRDAELAWLRGAWRGARRGVGRILFVSGRNGIGKTALAAALAAHVAAQGYEVLHAGAGGAALALVGSTPAPLR